MFVRCIDYGVSNVQGIRPGEEWPVGNRRPSAAVKMYQFAPPREKVQSEMSRVPSSPVILFLLKSCEQSCWMLKIKTG